jgi:hypothetical protein
MISLILLAAVRARSELATDRPLTWLLFGGLTLAPIGSIGLWYAHRIGPRRSTRMPLSPVGG